MEDKKNEIIQFVDGDLRLDVTLNEDTVWLTTNQIAELFGRDRTSINRHINKLYRNNELDRSSTCAKFAHVEEEKDRYGKTRLVKREDKEYFNLDVILAVGYRVDSKRGIQFRKWANSILKKYIIDGYAVNTKRLEVLNRTVEIQNNIIAGFAEMAGVDAKDVLEVVETYSTALNLLDDYDHQIIKKPKGRNTVAYLSKEACDEIIRKTRFYGQSDLFGKERPDCSLKGILNQIKQNVFGQELYPTVEEKAANLLYMLIKDHIYFDGNKRIAAILFLEFLNRNHILYKENKPVLSNGTLVAITLMIACSHAEEKDIFVNIVMNLLLEK